MKNKQGKRQNAGFTLVELLIAMVVSIIIMGAIYAVYESQTRTRIAQEVNVELQESLRAALIVMGREIRSAGADPQGGADAGILVARSDELRFTRDVRGETISGWPLADGAIDFNAGEDIRYKLAGSVLGRDTDGNGADNDAGFAALLENVDAMDFVYLDSNGDRLAAPVANQDLDEIRSVQVTIVARSSQSDRGLLTSYTDNTLYENLQGEVIFGPADDTARRLSISTTITCRNLGTGS